MSVLVIAGCTNPSGLYDPLPADQRGIRHTLASHTHLAPIRGALRDKAGAECRVPNWIKLHPDRPDRMWTALRAIDLDAEFVDPLLGWSEDRLVFADAWLHTTSNADPPLDVVALATPWQGDAPIACGDVSAVGGIVVRHVLLTQHPEPFEGLTRDDVIQIASENVARDGILAVDDFDLSIENLCVTQPEPGMPCVFSEPPEP
ncbi:MAG: hypothetical protein IT383_14040 [Deltaproteobacteria bacterium]|nr:hypothetical protein [Deltaproteobacteria bacterium]